jgi:hypothetical protein
MRFHQSIKTTDSRGNPTGRSRRAIVLDLMRIAGYENDKAKWTALYIENPIGWQSADEAWQRGVAQRLSK